eukprot:1638883-Rhodomonas_salina.1
MKHPPRRQPRTGRGRRFGLQSRARALMEGWKKNAEGKEARRRRPGRGMRAPAPDDAPCRSSSEE